MHRMCLEGGSEFEVELQLFAKKNKIERKVKERGISKRFFFKITRMEQFHTDIEFMATKGGQCKPRRKIIPNRDQRNVESPSRHRSDFGEHGECDQSKEAMGKIKSMSTSR